LAANSAGYDTARILVGFPCLSCIGSAAELALSTSLKIVPILELGASTCCWSNKKLRSPFVAKLTATPDAVIALSPALADAILPFLNKFPDACFGLRLPFAPMHAFAKATASKRAKPLEPSLDGR
jgi:hypothetical protein